MKFNLLIAGVGGQGTLLTSKILADYACKKDLFCKISEVHGMSQRGGAVVTHVKISDTKIYSPVLSNNEADYLIAFEKLESLRWLSSLKDGGIVIVNDHQILPMPVMSKLAVYPENVFASLEEMAAKVHVIDAIGIATKIASPRLVNSVMLGAFAKLINLDKQIIIDSIKELSPKAHLENNLLCFETGYNSL